MHVVCFLTGSTIMVAIVAACIGLSFGLGFLGAKIKGGMGPNALKFWEKVGNVIAYIMVAAVLLCVAALLYWIAMTIGCGVWHHS